ncbi:MAG: leucine-rich repeat protein [Marinilabiliaceae bacterium]|nr:leucine-rich repeat protein [Marinilabiliaceae bacterium]
MVKLNSKTGSARRNLAAAQRYAKPSVAKIEANPNGTRERANMFACPNETTYKIRPNVEANLSVCPNGNQTLTHNLSKRFLGTRHGYRAKTMYAFSEMRKILVLAILMSLPFIAKSQSSGSNIDLSYNHTSNVSGTGWSYNATTQVYTISTNATGITISGNNSGSQRRIVALGTASITLNNVSITLGEDNCPLQINLGNVTITLLGTNTLTAGNNRAGIQTAATTTLIITGEGSLNATGGNGSAGIGGSRGINASNSNGNFWEPDPGGATGTIIINSGTIIANGGSDAAGIGGGRGGNGTSNINYLHGAAGGSGGTITINGGTVIVTGGTNAGAIGGGRGGNGSCILTCGNGGAGGAGGTITITGGTITTSGGNGGIGFGGSGGNAGNGIGGNNGATGANGTLNMNGNGIVFTTSATSSGSRTGGILVVGNTTNWYGGNDFTMSSSGNIPSGYTLTIANGRSFSVASGVTLSINSGGTLANNGTVTPANGSSIIINGSRTGNLIQGANVSAPTLNNRTATTITIYSSQLLAYTSQWVEYACVTSNSPPSSGWQSSTSFAVNSTSTYYIFARSASNSDFQTGSTSSSLTVGPPCIPVTSITGVPSSTNAGTPLTLSGTVNPSNATNKTINWSVQNAGGTGASISGNTLYTTSAGTVTVRATITNGNCTSNYTQDFSIAVSAAPIPIITINTHPEPITEVTEGIISGNLSVSASVTQGATLSYQWHSNTTNSNSGGTIISGETNASFPIPTTLTIGTYYYYCVVSATGGATSVTSNVGIVNVLPFISCVQIASGQTGNLQWLLCSDGTLSISGVGTMPNYSGTAPWYSYRTDITQVVIGSGVATIGNLAFLNCSNLELIEMSSVTSIGNYAFQGCSGLTELIIPNSVTSIGSGAFYSCSGLTELTIGNSVTEISNPFFGCSGLKKVFISDGTELLTLNSYSFASSPIEEVYMGRNVENSSESSLFGTAVEVLTIGNCVTSICNYAFRNCSGLTELTIGNSVTSISNYAFYNCTGLTELTIGNSVTSIGNNAFQNCSGLTELTIPNSVTSIGNSAFSGCSGLAELTIPNSVTSISNYAFQNCSGLTELTIPNSVTSIGNNAFQSCSGLAELSIGKSVTTIGSYAFESCSGLTELIIPNSVISIGQRAFYNCSTLKKVVISDGSELLITLNNTTNNTNHPFASCPIEVVYMGRNVEYNQSINAAFFGTTVEVLTIGNSVTSIGNYAFVNCSGLTELTIGNSVTSIGERAFSGCNGLTELIIPNSVTSIGNYAFQNCTGLTELTIPNSVTSIGVYTFYGCSGLTELTIPNSVTTIGGYAFSGCSGLTELIIPNSVISIGSGAFQNCSGLTELTIGNSVTSIGNNAFQNCTGLSELAIPNSVTSIGNSAFYNCSILRKVVISDGSELLSLNITSTTQKPFDSCPIEEVYMGRNVEYSYGYSYVYSLFGTAVEVLTIGNCVTSIGVGAFSGCSGLTELTIGNSVTTIYGSAFSYCSGLTELTIPNSVTTIGGYAFENCNGLKIVIFSDGTEQLTLGGDAHGSAHVIFQNCPIEVVYMGRDLEYTLMLGFSLFGTSFNHLTIGNSVTSIVPGAFWGCQGLKKVVISDSELLLTLNAFPYSPFVSCPIEEVYMGRNVQKNSISGILFGTAVEILTIGNSVTSIGNEAFQYCSELTELTIGNSVTSIGTDAFQNCSGLTELIIPNSVTTIGGYAFGSCTSLINIINHAVTPQTINANNVFSNVNRSLITLHVPVCTDADYLSAGWTGFGSIVEIEGSGTPPIIITTTLPDGTVGIPYSQIFEVDGCEITNSIQVGNLPIGLTFNSTTGVISGTPTTAGTFNFIIKSENVAGFDEKELSIEIGKGTPIVTFPTSATLVYGQTLAEAVLSGHDGDGVFAFTNSTIAPTVAQSGELYEMLFTPTETNNYNNVSQDVAIIVEKATPTYTEPAGLTATYGDLLSSVMLPEQWAWQNPTDYVGNAGEQTHKATFTPDDTDNYIVATDVDVTITIAKATGALVSTPSLHDKTCSSITINPISEPESGQAIEYARSYSDIAPSHPNDWQISNVFDDLTAETQYFIFARAAENENYHVGNVSSSLLVTTEPVFITTTTLPDGLINEAYSQTLDISCNPPYTWSVISGSLPNGLNIDSTTGEISGIPTVVGTFNFTVRASNNTGNATQVLSIYIGNLGIDNISQNGKLQVYPNPTSGQFSVVSSEISVFSIEIFDAAGRLVHREPCTMNRATVEIDISHLSTGVYFVKVGNEIVKIVVSG